MIYFYQSTKKGELQHPITVCSSSEKRAFGMALVNFLKNGLKGSPVLLAV